MNSGKTFLGIPIPKEPTEWEDVHLYGMDGHAKNLAIMAILEHLGCTLKVRWEPSKGVVHQCFERGPKA